MMKGNFLRYFLVMMIAILASSACFAQTNQGYSKKKTVTTMTVSRSRSSKKQKSGSHQSYSSSKQSGNQNYDVPIFNMDEILKKIECQDYIVFLSRTGVVYGFNKNTKKYFTIHASTENSISGFSFFDSSKGIVKLFGTSDILFYYLYSAKTSIAPKLSSMSWNVELKKELELLRIIIDGVGLYEKETIDACISRYNICRRIMEDFEGAFDYYYGRNVKGLTSQEAKSKLINAMNCGHEDARTIYNDIFVK